MGLICYFSFYFSLSLMPLHAVCEHEMHLWLLQSFPLKNFNGVIPDTFGWRFGVVVVHWFLSMKLTYAEPG